MRIDFDATITIAHSEKDNAAATWKRTFGFHPLLAFLDRPEIAGAEALAGLLRKGNGLYAVRGEWAAVMVVCAVVRAALVSRIRVR